jgi:hypothetical protein
MVEKPTVPIQSVTESIPAIISARRTKRDLIGVQCIWSENARPR